jgi:hypothetical protein
MPTDTTLGLNPNTGAHIIAALDLEPVDDCAYSYARAKPAAVPFESARPNPDGRCQGCGQSVEVTQTHCARCKYSKEN